MVPVLLSRQEQSPRCHAAPSAALNAPRHVSGTTKRPLPGAGAGQRTVELNSELHLAILSDFPSRVECDFPAMLVRVCNVAAEAAVKGGVACSEQSPSRRRQPIK